MIWARMLAYITGTVDQELLLRNEYLAAENRILRAQIKGRLLLSNAEKATLAEIAHRLGRKALEELAAVAKPDTLLAWYRKLIAKKFDGSKFRKSRGRPRVDEETERWVVRMAKENPGWGYDRIVGAMANLGFGLSDQTVGNILRRHDIPPAPKRRQATSWKDFIRTHMAVLAATDFFTVEVLTLRGLMTYYVLFFIHLESRRICLAGITRHPDQEWMEQMARNVTMEDFGFLIKQRYLLHDRDSKYCSSFRQVIEAGGVKPLALPPRSPNLNAYAERWVRSVKEECLAKLIWLSEGSLRHALRHYEAHYHEERNHQSKDNQLSVVLAVLKLTVAAYWSWWRVMLPLLAFLGHNALYILAGLLCFRWLKHEEEESTTAEKHSREGYNIAALLFFFLFLDNLLRNVERQGWEGFWPCSGRFEVVVLYGVLSLLGQFAYWSLIVSHLNREHA